jgi:hypothetical protein
MVSPDEAQRLPKEQLLNEEQPIHPLYAYLYVVDKYEGLIVVNAATLLDGDPLNNYLKRQLDASKYPNGAFNPDGALTGANNITIAGTYAYITTEQGLAIVDLTDPLNPKLVNRIGAPQINHPNAIAIQFRYGFLVDADGFKVIDVSDPAHTRVVEGAFAPVPGAADVYVARTYAYLAWDHNGMVIVDIRQPEKPIVVQSFTADGKLDDVKQVKVAMTNASLFAYVAGGIRGLQIVQLTSPETMPTYAGFSPRPQPQLIATFKTKGEALAVSKPLDRDRAVDESGNQIAVFGRRGARPFTAAEVQRMLRTNGGTGEYFSVSDEPSTGPRAANADDRAPGNIVASVMAGLLVVVFGYSGMRKRYRRTLQK